MTIYAKSNMVLHIGRAGEHLATEVVFDISDWINDYGNGNVELIINQNRGLYFQPKEYLVVENGLVTWKVIDSNTEFVGNGKCELIYLVDDVKVKSAIYDIVVTKALDSEEGANPPNAFKTWVDELVAKADTIESAKEDVEAAEAWATGTINGIPVTSDKEQYENSSKYWASAALAVREGIEELKAEAEAAHKAAIEIQGKIETSSQEIFDARDTTVKALEDAESIQTRAEEVYEKANAALEEAESINDTIKNAETNSVQAKDAAQIAQSLAEKARDGAVNAQSGAEDAKVSAVAAKNEALEIKEEVFQINSNPPYMNTETNNWMVWDKEKGTYKDSGIKFSLTFNKVYDSTAEMYADVTAKNSDLAIIRSDVNTEENSRTYLYDGTEWNYLSDLSGLQGVGIREVRRTSGTGAAGSTDEYTIYLTDGNTFTFSIYNGKDGEGFGDMATKDYDSTGAVAAAGGIDKYMQEKSTKIIVQNWTVADLNN